MKEIRINSWNELLDEMFQGAFNEDIKRFRSPCVFRGMSNKDMKLENTLHRNCGDKSEKLEKSLVRNFSKYAAKEIALIPGIDSVWKTLAIGQHHGLPTRLLDWTYSPLIALHFATEDLDEYDKDGVIWCVNHHNLREILPVKAKKVLEEESSFVFTNEMMSKLFSGLSQFNTSKAGENDYFLFFEPPAIDFRIINQYALFSIPTNIEKPLEELITSESSKKLIIPKELKWEFRDKLDQLNINERVLFGGLTGLTSWLARQYITTK
ncbi:MAG: FRG domain-containing protein [Candidatus Izimaplasma sp.]|nr:FRG domain-containing protein [Candidatus Izimaplasma bacterium]